MGGLAFRQLGLYTPRMTAQAYIKLSETITMKLKKLFRDVRIPKPTPGKTTYGDLDFLVQDPYTAITAQDVRKAIGASHYLTTGHTWNFAVPAMTEADNLEQEEIHRQVDVHICDNNIEWEEFLDSYGDLWTILGTLTRFCGFLCDDKGFHLLVSPIDKEDKKASKVLLTKSPKECLRFLNLDITTYENGFETVVKMFDYITTSKIFTPEAFSKSRLTHNDRAKARQRPVYLQWLECYLPSVDMKLFATRSSRAELEQEATEIFGKGEEVQSKRQVWSNKRREKEWWGFIADTLPLNDHERTLTVRALKKKFVTLDPPLEVNTREANQFVEQNWQLLCCKLEIQST